MAKKAVKTTPKVKFVGDKAEGNVLKAKIPTTITGDKIAFPHRYMKDIDTGVRISEIEPGYKLCFSLTQALASKGMIVTNGPGNITSGLIVASVLNCGREIVEIRNGDPLLNVWLEVDQNFEWVVE